MKTNKFVLVYLSLAFIFSHSLLNGQTDRTIQTMNQQESKQQPLYQQYDQPLEKRLEDLISGMTLEEKISQMQYNAPAIERLEIPKYNWWNECLHGVARAGIATVFPQAIGLAATWNTDLMHKVATVISDEARAKHHEAVRNGERGIYQGLTFWSPNINIFRDPRWGRGQETYGEDPYLTSRMGIAFVKGLQGNHPDYLKVVATPKHYAVHSGPEPDRHHFNAQISERDLWDTYLPAFEACITEGKAYSVMCAYNRYAGEACCASKKLLQQILRGKWGFKGYVVSDCGAIQDIFADHHLASTAAEAAAMAVKSGCDLNCGSQYPNLLEAVEKGFISEAILNKSVKRLYRARFRLGMFDPPQKVPYSQIPYSVNNSEKHRKLSVRAAQESIVLLKNDQNLLPLDQEIRSIAVIGPCADNIDVLLGNYHGTPSNPITILEGIRQKASEGTKVRFAKGCEIAQRKSIPITPIPGNCLMISDFPNSETGLKGEYFNNMNLKGEPALVRNDSQIDFNWEAGSPAEGINKDQFSVRWTGYLVPDQTGEYKIGIRADDGFRLFLNGKKVVELWTDHAPQTRTKMLNLQANKRYRIRIEYYENGGGASVMFGWIPPNYKAVYSQKIADEYQKALNIASNSDVVVFVGGITPKLEGEEMSVAYEGFEGGDRVTIGLPDTQKKLLKTLHKNDTPVVLVQVSGSALAVNWAQDHIPAIMAAWYPGQEGGTAVADVLFGDYNPAGRLPVTFYKSVDQLPPFDEYSMKGRTYRYFDGEVLYPFGYGLSYTTFKYSNLQISPRRPNTDQPVYVNVNIKNTGDLSGEEVVQLYISDLKSTIPVPIHSLRAFKRVHLKPEEEKIIHFELTTDDFSIVNDRGERIVEPGEFEIMVGRNSSEGLEARIVIEK